MGASQTPHVLSKQRCDHGDIQATPPANFKVLPVPSVCPSLCLQLVTGMAQFWRGKTTKGLHQDGAGLARGSSWESNWLPTDPVPDPRQLGLQEGTSSIIFILIPRLG